MTVVKDPDLEYLETIQVARSLTAQLNEALDRLEGALTQTTEEETRGGADGADERATGTEVE